MSRCYDCCYHRHFVTSLANIALACARWHTLHQQLDDKGLTNVDFKYPTGQRVVTQSNVMYNIRFGRFITTLLGASIP